MKRLALALLAGALVVALFLFVPWRDTGDWSPDNLPAGTANAGSGAGELAAPGLGSSEADRGESNTSEVPDRKELPAGIIRVAGRLVNSKGVPLGDTTVDLHLGDGQDRRNWSPFAMVQGAKKPDSETKSDPDGRFYFKVPLNKGGQLALPEGDLVWEKRPPRFLGSRDNLDLGDLAVFRGAVMKGRVLTPDDQPVEKAKLRFMGYEGQGYIPRAAESDARGRFELRGLPRGDGYLTVTCPGHVGLYKRITIAAGETLDGVIVRLRRGVELIGLVVDDQWNPIADASVRVTGPGHRTEDGQEYSNGSAQTDAKGAFRVAGLGTGPYQVRAKAKGHVSKSLDNIKLEGGEVRLELPRLGSITGHVVDERGQPITGSTVYSTTKAPNLQRDVSGMVDASIMWGGMNFASNMTHNSGQRQNSVKTDEEGRFVLDDIKPGRVWLVAGGAHPRAVQGPLEIVAGKRLEGIEIAARRGGVATVRVSDPEGNPIEKVQVRLSQPAKQPAGGLQGLNHSIQGLPMTMGPQPRVASAVTDKNGECEFAGVDSGEYEVHATHRSWVSPKPVRLGIPAKGRVETRLVMQAGGTVAIRVVDYQDRPAAEQGFLILQGQRRTKSGRTDATGRATACPLAVGNYEAVLQNTMGNNGVMLWGYFGNQSFGVEVGARVAFHISANKTVDVLLTRPKLASLAGTVRDDTGLRKNARVFLMRKPENSANRDMSVLSSLQRTRTDGDGGFRFEGLQPGTYDLAVQRDRSTMLFRVEVAIRGTGAHLQDVYLATGSVQVEVHSAGKPVGGLKLELHVQGNSPLHWQGGAQQVSAVSDVTGLASFQDVPPGQYSIRVRSKDYAKAKAELFEVTAGELTKKKLDVEPATTLSVECVPAEGTKKPGLVQLELTRDGDGNKPTRHWLQGENIKLRQLRPGRYRIRALRMGQQGGASPWSPVQPVDLQIGKSNRVRIVLP